MARLLLMATAALALCSCSQHKSPREKTLIDSGWEFKAEGEADWTPVDLPHDWSIAHDFDSLSPAGNDGGYLPTAKLAYRRQLDIGKKDGGACYWLLFEGAYMGASVAVNGIEAAAWPYGYSTFQADITACLKDGVNEIEVSVDNSNQKNCRWYSGTGIYRHVWLVRTGGVFVNPLSVFVTSPDASEAEAEVNVSFDAVNRSGTRQSLDASAEIWRGGKMIDAKSQRIEAADTTPASFAFKIESPSLWSPDTPEMYEARIILRRGSETVDEYGLAFGIRKFECDSENGLRLNGKPIILNGGCIHHDNGMLGAASYDAAEARKVRLLKEAGFNAVRTSHNPPSPAFLDECDRQGLVVIDEAFDGWRQAKTPHDYAGLFDDWALRDAEAMVLRDRNHPSVLAWSIGNEILERKNPEAVEIAHRLAALCRSLDPTRPVTQALASWDADWEIYDPLAAEHDIVGYNYMIHKAETDHERVPERVIWQTESYPRDAFQNWAKAHDLPYVIGDFVWTAIDYLGESGIGRHYYRGESEGEHFERDQWPWHGALCGDIDLLGQRRPISHYREMLYSDKPALGMAVLEPDGYKGEIRETLWGHYPAHEHWNWRGHEGKPITVAVYSNADSVRLWLNGSLAGEKAVGRVSQFLALFTIPYRPGILRAESSSGLSQEIATAGEPAAIRLTADRENIVASGQDLAYVLAEIVDKDGVLVPDCDVELSFSVEGVGALVATGSADVKDTRGYHRPVRRTSEGRAMAVVKSASTPGIIRLTASAPGLPAADITIPTSLPAGS